MVEKVVGWSWEAGLVWDDEGGAMPYSWMVHVREAEGRDDGRLAVKNFSTREEAVDWAVRNTEELKRYCDEAKKSFYEVS